jgi:hypothetical protein
MKQLKRPKGFPPLHHKALMQGPKEQSMQPAVHSSSSLAQHIVVGWLCMAPPLASRRQLGCMNWPCEALR